MFQLWRLALWAEFDESSIRQCFQTNFQPIPPAQYYYYCTSGVTFKQSWLVKKHPKTNRYEPNRAWPSGNYGYHSGYSPLSACRHSSSAAPTAPGGERAATATPPPCERRGQLSGDDGVVCAAGDERRTPTAARLQPIHGPTCYLYVKYLCKSVQFIQLCKYYHYFLL